MRLLAAALTALALPASAQTLIPQVEDCDWQASAASIAEPWEAHTRTFANGKTRLAMLDTIEPAGGWAWLLVLSPPYDEVGGRQCKVIGTGGMGFSGMDFAALTADYNPAQGLIFDLPVREYITGMDSDPTRILRVVLNQATGAITAKLR